MPSPVPRTVSSVGRYYGLDVLRGVAIVLVLLRHSWPGVFGGAGIVGVVMFFALSGYLITGLLMKDIDECGRVRYGRFYMHRAFRLIPALAFMLAGFAVIEGVWNILGDRNEIFRSVVVGMTYTMNIPGFGHGSDALSHLWTLATEEQFYLVWPVLLLLGMKRWGPVRTVAIATFGVLALCAVTIFVASPDVFKVYSLPTSWAAAMLIGAWARIEHDKLVELLSAAAIRMAAGVISSIVLVCLCFIPDPKQWPVTYLVGGPLIAVCTMLVIFAFAQRRGFAPVPLRPLVWLGTISYSAYLWNYPISQWVGPPLSFASGTLVIVLTLVASTISWFAVEAPATDLRKRLDRRRDNASAPISAGRIG